MRALLVLGVLAAVVGCGDDSTGGSGSGGSGGGGATTGASATGSTTGSSSTGGPSADDIAADERYCAELCECDDFPGSCPDGCVESQALDRQDFAGSPCEAEANAWFTCQTSEAECVDGATVLGTPDCAAVNAALEACQDGL
jgi:hypothetical protein